MQRDLRYEEPQVGRRRRGIPLPRESPGDQSISAGRETPVWENLAVLSRDIQAVCLGQGLAPKRMQYTHTVRRVNVCEMFQLPLK